MQHRADRGESHRRVVLPRLEGGRPTSSHLVARIAPSPAPNNRPRANHLAFRPRPSRREHLESPLNHNNTRRVHNNCVLLHPWPNPPRPRQISWDSTRLPPPLPNRGIYTTLAPCLRRPRPREQSRGKHARRSSSASTLRNRPRPVGYGTTSINVGWRAR